MNPKTKIPVSANMSHSSSRSPNLLSQFFFPTMCPLLLLFITLETNGSTKSVERNEQGICQSRTRWNVLVSLRPGLADSSDPAQGAPFEKKAYLYPWIFGPR